MYSLIEGLFVLLLLEQSFVSAITTVTNSTDFNDTPVTTLDPLWQYLGQLQVFTPANSLNSFNWSEYDPSKFTIPSPIDKPDRYRKRHDTYAGESWYETFKQYKSAWSGLFGIVAIVAAIVYCCRRKKNLLKSNNMQLATVEVVTPSALPTQTTQTPVIPDSQPQPTACYRAAKAEETLSCRY